MDATNAAGLDFFGAYGPTFVPKGLDPMIQRNMGNGVAVGDYDGDGDLDVYFLGNLGFPNVLYRNNLEQGSKTFTNVTGRAGVGDLGLSRVAHFVDLDDDGDLDLIVVNDDDGDHPSRVFRNDGDGRFTDRTAGSNFAPEGYLRCGVAIADYDRDGLLDIYVTNWGLEVAIGHTLYPGSNRLYRNLGDFVFEDVTETSGLGVLARDSFTAIFTDFNEDDWPDLYVAIDYGSDEFYLNEKGRFVRVTEEVLTTHIGNDMGVACADFDDDGDLDMYVTNITGAAGQLSSGQNNVFYVQHGTPDNFWFADEAMDRGVEDTYWGWGTEFIDVENDGDLDIVATNGFREMIEAILPGNSMAATPTVLFINDSTGQFERAMAPGLDSTDDGRALIAFDYDRDGDEDILITNVDGPARLFENVTTPQGHWLDVAVTQRPGQNRNGIGVTVYAEMPNGTKRRDIIIGDSYLSGGPAEVHFGLSRFAVLPELRVEWTDGTVSTYRHIAADRRLHIYQIPGDADRDGRVTLDDFGLFAKCVEGSEDVRASICSAFDFNLDSSTSLLDFGGFQIVAGGS